jgi:hypothetical protein
MLVLERGARKSLDEARLAGFTELLAALNEENGSAHVRREGGAELGGADRVAFDLTSPKSKVGVVVLCREGCWIGSGEGDLVSRGGSVVGRRDGDGEQLALKVDSSFDEDHL